jgi:hypothetical protein
MRWERDGAQKKRRGAEAELERVRSENARPKQIIEELRGDLANVSEHAELERMRAEVAKLGPRVTEQDAKIGRLAQIECC